MLPDDLQGQLIHRLMLISYTTKGRHPENTDVPPKSARKSKNSRKQTCLKRNVIPLSLIIFPQWKKYCNAHCIVHSIVTVHRAISYNQLLHQIETEFSTNFSDYLQFGTDSSDLKKQMRQFIDNKRYNLSVVDSIPLVIANVLQAKINIYEEHDDGSVVLHTVQPRKITVS